eukprot:2480760-Amphidinium_carterae.1
MVLCSNDYECCISALSLNNEGPNICTSCIVAGLLTGFGLDLLADKLSGPTVDRATLQLVAVLFASILLPGVARALVAQLQKIKQSP